MSKPKPWRYKTVERPLTFWQSVRVLLQTQQWRTKEVRLEVVNPDDPEYEHAPFESAVIFARAFDAPFPEAQITYKR